MNTLLAAAAGLLAVVTVFFGLPSTIYAGNPGEFTWPATSVVLAFWPWGVGSLAALVLPGVLLPSRAGRWWAAFVTALAVYVWASGYFQIHDFGVLDGRGWSPDVPAWQSILEVAMIALGFAAVVALVRRAPGVAAGVLAFITAGVVAEGAFSIPSDARAAPKPGDQNVAGLYDFSAEKNVLIVINDTAQSDVFEELIRNGRDLRRIFDGFYFFPDTVGVAPTTYLSMPSIHSGVGYDGKESLPRYFEREVGQNSFLNRFTEAGYDGALINPAKDVCPQRVRLCAGMGEALSGRVGAWKKEAATLLDMALFRVTPAPLKSTVYNDGEWTVQHWMHPPQHIHLVLKSNIFLEEFAARVTASAAEPTIKLLHLMNTHPPYLYDENCEYTGRRWPTSRERDRVQMRCALLTFSKLISAMEAQGIYDNTVIAVIGDHGNYLLHSNRVPSRTRLSSIVGEANPLFAVKPAGSSGPMVIAEGEVAIGDLGATLCDLTGDCSTEPGVSAFDMPRGRKRVFHRYQWKPEYWSADTIPNLQTYVVEGPIWDTSSWSGGPTIAAGDVIEFNNEGQGILFQLQGWSGAEKWGTWSVDKTASLALPIRAAEGPHVLRMRVGGFIGSADDQYGLTVSVNGKVVGRTSFNVHSRVQELVLPIPEDALERGNIVVDLEPSRVASPAALGLSTDTRMLGVGMHWLKVERARSVEDAAALRN